MNMFYHKDGVILLGGAKINYQLFQPFVDTIPNFYCADGGVNQSDKITRKINAVIGDLDSADLAKYDGKVSQTVRISGQDDTDFEKCLSHIQARFYVCLGFLGGRLDHTMANLSSLARFKDKPVFLIDEENLCFRLPKRLKLDLPVSTRLSLYPLTQAAVSSEGLKWEVTGLELSPVGQISTSNKTGAAQVALSCESGDVLVITEAAYLQTIIEQAVPQMVANKQAD